MSDRKRLALYQARLLDSLHSAQSVTEASAAIRRLASEANLAEMEGLDERMVFVAMELTKRWGVRKADGQ